MATTRATRKPRTGQKPVANPPATPPGPPPRNPIPTAVTYSWFPAIVRAPGHEHWVNCKVYATPQGLYVYKRPPGPDDPDGRAAAFFSPIDYSKTPDPGGSYRPTERNTGFTVHTEAGPVIVQKQGGCGCGMRALKSWAPSWARLSMAWKEMAQ